VLYELLTGSTPLQRAKLRQANYMEIVRRIREDETPKPSTRLSDSKDTLATISAQRKIEPARLTRLVRGELDWIVMRALEKDRVRRYDTPNALARDIQRYLAGDPVEAGPPSATYRLRKFARKYRPWLLTASAFAGLLVSLTAVSVWQALRATQAERAAPAERNRALDAEKVAQLDRNRALEAEKVAIEQTERAQKAEQTARAELERVATQVRRIKEATVYLKYKVAGKTLPAGTGFVVEVNGDSVLVATSRQVARLDLSDLPMSLERDGSLPEIEAVFRNGEGPPNEQARPARVIAADTSDELSTDLAILVVKGVTHPPAPINILNHLDPTEGMAYLGAGFSSGGMLSTLIERGGDPSITISRGGIAALRRDERGHITLLQMDGAVMPGDSGGPVVEERTGTLIGVGVSHVSSMGDFIGVPVARLGSVDPIGFVVPADEVRRALAGRVGALDLTLQSLQSGTADLQIKAELVDPKGMVNAVMVRVAPSATALIVPYSDGSWPRLPDTIEVELQHDPITASASGRVRVALRGQGAAARKILIQTVHRYRSGQLVYSNPRVYDLPDKPGRVRPRRIARILRDARPESVAVLEPLVDPDKDCRLVKDDLTYTIKIEVPGNKVHTLAPEVVTRLNKRKPLHNAPMSLIEIDGDFAALVQVTGDINPGSTLPKDGQDNIIPFTFQTAGLLLYQDRDNFVRLERSAGVAIETLQPIHKVLFEVVKDGKSVDQSYAYVPEGPVYLLLMRRKGRVTFGTTGDLAALPVPIKQIKLDLPDEVKIGLSASNNSAKPFTATFENFALVTDVTIIDAEFGNDGK
jgi:S1-C subfamily serine protease